jgi:Family of unknown function (DUF6328)
MEDETEKQRVNRELIELLNELRVALPGVQVLFAFLLAVPFQQRFATTSSFEHIVYFTTLFCAALATALLITPSAYHRINFRAREKGHIVLTSNGLAIAGLVFLAAAMVGAVLLITDFLFGTVVAVIFSSTAALVFVCLWFVMPLRMRSKTSHASR